MRLTQQERLSLSVVLLILVLALLGYVIFWWAYSVRLFRNWQGHKSPTQILSSL